MIDKKQFNPSRKWSFKCGNCSTKVSSQDGGNYFTINPSLNWNLEFTTETGLERACSEGCIKVIAKDFVREWVKINPSRKLFVTEDLEERLTELIKKCIGLEKKKRSQLSS
ncbi:hypothetical protein [Cytobacillus sp. Bac17]|nr:hypothetical protein [Cytobacillus sp. Bac17]